MRYAFASAPVILGLRLASAAFAAQAQPSPQPAASPEAPPQIKEELTVMATRTELALRAVGPSVTVIDREEIESRHLPTALELLRTLPGLEVAQTGGPGRVASVFIRGGGSAHTLVLVDGVRVNSNSGGGFDFSLLGVEDLERIEVLKGPQSTLYGSEAMAGVVSVTTRAGSGAPRPWLEAEGGQSEHRRAVAGVGGQAGRADFSASLGGLWAGGLSVASPRNGNVEEDESSSATATGRLGLRFSDDGRVDLATRYVSAETALDGFTFGTGPTDDPNYTQQSRLLTTRLSVAKSVTPRFKQTLAVGLTDDTLEGDDPDTPFNNYDIDERSLQLTAQSDVSLGGHDLLTVGLQHEDREAVNRDNFDQDVSLRSIFVQEQWSWRERLHLTGNVRYDDHSQFGGETTYRGTASYEPASGTRLRATYGTGFRAPALDELYFPHFGNPALRPETSRGFEVGVEQRLVREQLLLAGAYFSTDYRDLIGFDVTTFTANNVARARARGVEVSAAYRSGRTRFQVSHTYTDGENQVTGEALARRPRHRSTLQASFAAGAHFSGTLSAMMVRDRIDSDGTALDDYTRVDLALDRSFGGTVKLYFRVLNLFDADYEEVAGYSSPGRVAVLGTRLRF
jgi:vitamin B12 transporter